jgi:hypothetical protein
LLRRLAASRRVVTLVMLSEPANGGAATNMLKTPRERILSL